MQLRHNTNKFSRYSRIIVSGILASLLASAVPERAAFACGGCFSPTPPPGAVFAVTDHRMVLSLSAQQTTLWDQFTYAGDPAEFAWVLPIRNGPEVRVALADDQFISLLDSLSTPVIQGQPQRPTRDCGVCIAPQSNTVRCPVPNNYGFADSASLSFDASYSADVPAQGGDVVIHSSEVVGPYQVTILGGNDAMAVRNWLTMNGYNIPAAIEPVLMNYIDMHMDFVAVRLRGSQGLRRMQPLKITMPGLQAVLPLQMVAAGVGDKVGLTLMVLADARYEAQNFSNFAVRSEDLTFDFAAPISGSDSFRAESRRLDQLAGGGWQTESATQQNANVLQGIAARIRPSPPSPDGTSTSAAQDLATARLGLGDLPILTRLRAELPASALTRDLLLRASAEGVKARDYTFLATTNTVTPPACPPLNCLSGWGRRETDGTIRDPFGQSVAPSTTFSGRYTAGSLPTHIAQVTTVEPSVLPRTYEQCRNSDGTLIPRTGGGGCAVRSAPANPRGLMPLLAGIAMCVSLRRKRQSSAK